MVICLERGADLHMAQLMPLPLTVSCFSKIQTGFAFLVPAHLGSPGQRAVKRVCVSRRFSHKELSANNDIKQIAAVHPSQPQNTSSAGPSTTALIVMHIPLQNAPIYWILVNGLFCL